MICPLVFVGNLSVPSMMKIATSRGLLRWLAGWLAGHRFGPLCSLVASRHSVFACWWHVYSTTDTWNKFQRAACLLAREHTSSWRGRMAQWWPGAMCVTTTSRITVSIILVVITTVKERRVVVISLLYSNVTCGDILTRHWIESATTMLVVAFTFALMARERRWSVRKL